MMKSLRILTSLLVAASVFGSCAKELTDLPDNTSDSEAISFGMDGSFWAKVQTKATEVTSLSSFYVTAVTGSAGSESQVWNSVQFNQVPGSSPATYVGDQSWPLSDPGYKFYGSNVALNFAAGGTYVNASNATDVVCAYLSSPTYKTKNTLTFKHIFARLCRVDVAAQSGYTVSNISMYITPKTGGTYNLRTGAGHTDGTGWSSVTSGSATLISDKTGATDNDIYMVPGNYAITCTWTATDASGVSVTHTNEASTLPIKGGATNNISVVLGGDIMLGVDLQGYCEYDYRDNLDYLTFYCDEAGTIGWKCSGASIARTIQYSKDFGSTWTDLTSTTSGATIAVNAGDIVWFKGSNTAYANYLFDSNGFTLSNKAHVYGNVNSLTGNNTSVSRNCFSSLFAGCSKLYTYEHKKIILPATTLAAGCYQSMFSGCASLTAAPELPATTLADGCYSYMFSGCTSLIAAPELPATTLASNCYSFMFEVCTSLTAAPELPATTLADFCYQYMFQGCSSLNYIKALFTTTPSSSYTNNWVSGVASTGTFVKSAAATWNVTGNNGVPTGWTVKRAAPEPLPGEFSVSATKKVRFAPGNLEAVIGGQLIDTYNYVASEWKFAAHQYDYIGDAAGNTTFAVGSTVDLFGWVGESASYDSYGLCTNTDLNNEYYGTSDSDAIKTDWGTIPGVVSALGSGWSTLTNEENGYLFNSRSDASSKWGHGSINGINGMIILPDVWTLPANCSFSAGSSGWANAYTLGASGTSNAWVDMEAAGAVFLPAAGDRYGAFIVDVGSCGYYWSRSVFTVEGACYVGFLSGYLYPQDRDRRRYGYSVRLVKEAN